MKETTESSDCGAQQQQLSSIEQMKHDAMRDELCRIEEEIEQLREFRQQYNQNPQEHDQQEFQACKQLLEATEEKRDRLQQSLSAVNGDAR